MAPQATFIEASVSTADSPALMPRVVWEFQKCWGYSTSKALLPQGYDVVHDRRVSVTRPVMLYGLCALILFAPILEGGTTQTAVMIIRLLICGLLGLQFADAVRNGALKVPRTSLSVPVLVFLVLSVVSVVFSSYANQSSQWLLVLLSYAGLLYFVVIYLDRWEHLAIPFLVLIGTASFETAWGIAQVFGLDHLRATGTFFNPNFLAGYLALVWTPLLAYCSFFPYRRLKRLWSTNRNMFWGWVGRLAVPMVLCAVLLLGIVATGSRAGMLLVVCAFALIVGARRGFPAIWILLGLIVTIGVVPNHARDRLIAEHAANPFAYTRVQIWEAACQMMWDHPIGVGLGLYQYVSPRYAFPVEGQIARHERIAQTPHNEFLQIGAELGVAAVVVFASGIVMLFKEVHRRWVQRLGRWERMVLVGLSGSVLTVLVHALLDSNLHEPGIVVPFVLLLGALISFPRRNERADKRFILISIRSRWKWRLVGLVLLVVLVSRVVSIGVAWLEHMSGTQLAAQGNLTAALDKQQRSVNWDRGKSLYRNSLAATYYRLYRATGDAIALQRALRELDEANQLNPLDNRLHALRGFVYLSLAQDTKKVKNMAGERVHFLEALQAYQSAYELAPFNAEHAYHVGLVSDALGESEKAKAVVQQAVHLEPNFLVARAWLVQYHLAHNDPVSAQTEYREIVERHERLASHSQTDLERRFLAIDPATLGSQIKLAEEKV